MCKTLRGFLVLSALLCLMVLLPGVAASESLKYTTAAGTTGCGGAGFSSPASPPFSGEIDSDVACTTKTFDLGASCLYIGGGSASTVPPGATPAGASSYLDVGAGNTLVASNGTGMRDCTKGPSQSP